MTNVCDDCNKHYNACQCGTDPREYEENEFASLDHGVEFAQDAADVAYEELDNEDNYSDAEADADTLASAGMGTDEDYGCFDSGDDW